MKHITFATLLSTFTIAGMENLHINGFGTLGLTYQGNNEIIYTDTWRSDHGTDGEISLLNDTKFGLQLDWQATDKLDFTLQGTVDSEGANLEWANIKYTLNDNHNIKIGQMRFPTAMYSDILKVSYSYNWVRLPEDIYGILPLTSYIGAEYNYQNNYKGMEYRFKLYTGRSEDTMVGSQDVGDYTIILEHIYGANISLNWEDLSIRVGYTRTDITIDNERVNNYFEQAYQDPNLSSATKSILHSYDPRAKDTQYLSFGFKYDYQALYLLGEYVWIDMDNIISDNYAGYISTGYHYGVWTPHITYSKVKGKSNYSHNVEDPLVDAALEEMATRTQTNQEHITLGVRYDWKSNIALKMQYDHIIEGNEGRGISIHKEQPYDPENIHLISLSMDFIF